MRKTLYGTIAAGTFLAVSALAPAASAKAMNFDFHDVELSDQITNGIIYASTQVHKKKPDFVYCEYVSEDWQPLGYYSEFRDSLPVDIEQFCVENFAERWQ